MTFTAAPPDAPPTAIADSPLIGVLYNPSLWLGERLGLAALRREVLSAARGDVLEIGAGTGLNLPHYPAGLTRLVLAEPGPRIAKRIAVRRAPAGVHAELVPATAEALPFGDASFDTVVSTLVLCTVPDPRRALAEVARVLRPGGQLLFLEHVRAEPGWRRRLQERSARPWAAVAGGCRCDRPTLDTLRELLDVTSARRATWRGMPAIVKPLVHGAAVRRSG